MKSLIVAIALSLSACTVSVIAEDQLELCDGEDNDSDPSTLDGSDEEWIGSPCGPNGDMIGVTHCADGLIVCAEQ